LVCRKFLSPGCAPRKKIPFSCPANGLIFMWLFDLFRHVSCIIGLKISLWLGSRSQDQRNIVVPETWGFNIHVRLPCYKQANMKTRHWGINPKYIVKSIWCKMFLKGWASPGTWASSFCRAQISSHVNSHETFEAGWLAKADQWSWHYK
jgi:hypothetical protein